MKRKKSKVVIDNSGAAAAANANAAANAAAANLQKNFSTDLRNENIANVVTGNPAPLEAGAGSFRRKKPAGLASQLCIRS